MKKLQLENMGVDKLNFKIDELKKIDDFKLKNLENLGVDKFTKLKNDKLDLIENLKNEKIKDLENIVTNKISDCDEIKTKFEMTSTKITSSLTNLSEMVNAKAEEQDQIIQDISTIKPTIDEQQEKLEKELSENQGILN